MIKKIITSFLLMAVGCWQLSAVAQERRPIDSQHPLWLVHVDVWNSADPQKIIDLIPDDIKPYVCMNLSLSCQYDTEKNMYRMPRCAVRTYKSWGTVCQQNGMWFTCQPASGGHTHIQDDDLETFEYFFKQFPNFLGWNYAEQFWGFDESGDKSSSTQASRLALFAKLVPMHHKYGGFLTISFCGNIWSHGLNPMGMMKRNRNLLQACKDYPEACVWLYKYTTSSCWYNNESVTWGPYISGLAKNYGVRYDNCGWNGALSSILGENHGKKYPGAAGIGTVMEQTCMNGGAVWDGPELENLATSTIDGYTRRNWGMFKNFRGIWLDMWRKIIDGHMYIPTREEVIGKTKIVVVNDKTSGSDEDKYAAWGDLYDGLYKQTDPFNRGNGQWMDNFCYFKRTGRYGTIPLVIGFYDDLAKSIPVQVKKSAYTSRWSTTAKKTADFNEQYPLVSKGDLFVERLNNQLVTYTPYSYLNSKTRAQASIPLQYNTCDSLLLDYFKLSSGVIREYDDHIDFYLNNYRSDTTTVRADTIIIKGATTKPTVKLTRRTLSTASTLISYEGTTFKLTVKHIGPVDVKVTCSGNNEREVSPEEAAPLPEPKQPEDYYGQVMIEAEDMDYMNVRSVAITSSGWFAPDMEDFAGNGYVDMGTNKSGSLRHQLFVKHSGDYNIVVRYLCSTKDGNLKLNLNGEEHTVACAKTSAKGWQKASVGVTLIEGDNDLRIYNTEGLPIIIDQIIYVPADMEPEKYLVTVRETEHGSITPDVEEAVEGQTVTLTVNAEDGYQLKELRVVNSVYYTMAKTFAVNGTDQVTFTMPDDNVTLLPVFTDMNSVYSLDFAQSSGTSIPHGWRCTQENNEVHQYPNTYSAGARTMSGFTGYQGSALYWREVSAEYGRQSAYPLNLQAGDYKLSYVMAAWKGSPKYKVQILDASTGSSIATSATYTASPNANGVSTANLSSSTRRELSFTVSKAGQYVISFTNETNGSGLEEYLLLECGVRKDTTLSTIQLVANDGSRTTVVYDMSGRQHSGLTRGVNIIRTPDGKTRKVFSK